MKAFLSVLALYWVCTPFAHAQKTPNLDAVYRDQTHCLTAADMRGDQDMPISCYCRDAIADAQYVYATYIITGRDQNLNGTFLRLEEAIDATCGRSDGVKIAMDPKWMWDGPEVIRTYPPDDVIKRIEPSKRGKGWIERSVPFTVQLVYRDQQGKVIKTETYSAVEHIPEFQDQKPTPSAR